MLGLFSVGQHSTDIERHGYTLKFESRIELPIRERHSEWFSKTCKGQDAAFHRSY
jgi:hypothetical protein